MSAVLDGFVSSLMKIGEKAGVWAVGSVVAVSPTGASDGNPLVTVTWQGTNVRAAYLASYTAAVGHVVLMARFGPRLIILGRVIGTPPNS